MAAIRRRLPQPQAAMVGMNISCGVRELVGVSRALPENLIQAANTQHLAHVIFSDVVCRGGGSAFAKYITSNNLGTVIQSMTRMNPNSGNRIAVWVWTPDKKALREFQRRLTQE